MAAGASTRLARRSTCSGKRRPQAARTPHSAKSSSEPSVRNRRSNQCRGRSRDLTRIGSPAGGGPLQRGDAHVNVHCGAVHEGAAQRRGSQGQCTRLHASTGAQGRCTDSRPPGSARGPRTLVRQHAAQDQHSPGQVTGQRQEGGPTQDSGHSGRRGRASRIGCEGRGRERCAGGRRRRRGRAHAGQRRRVGAAARGHWWHVGVYAGGREHDRSRLRTRRRTCEPRGSSQDGGGGGRCTAAGQTAQVRPLCGPPGRDRPAALSQGSPGGAEGERRPGAGNRGWASAQGSCAGLSGSREGVPPSPRGGKELARSCETPWTHGRRARWRRRRRQRGGRQTSPRALQPVVGAFLVSRVSSKAADHLQARAGSRAATQPPEQPWAPAACIHDARLIQEHGAGGAMERGSSGRKKQQPRLQVGARCRPWSPPCGLLASMSS